MTTSTILPETQSEAPAAAAAAMAGFVCWDGTRLHSVLDPDALQMPDAAFMATHVRRRLRRVDPKNPSVTLGGMEPQELLHRFLSDDVPHMQAAVIGTSGAGKSRLIRWLAVHIPETPTRRVVLIEKVGTNLRGVLESILRDMKGPEFDAYRERLRKAAVGLSPATAPDEVLNQLQAAVGPVSTHATEDTGDDPDAADTREILMRELPPLLGDPKFREVLRRNTRIVGDLVTHAVGDDQAAIEAGGERIRLDERRSFNEDDLRVDRWGLLDSDVNVLARDMLRRLRSSQPWRRDACEWINRNLDDALGRLLSFTREDLGRMLVEVRRTLANQGRELVLLVEDFAKLQGVDYAILDAVSVRPENHPGGRLCRLRTILAMTSGYFGRIDATLSGRTDLVVDVDLPAGSDEDQDGDLVRIAARHLNALRLVPSELESWSGTAMEAARAGSVDLPVLPSRCDTCPHREPCHAAFGTAEEPGTEARPIGLYPYTAHALGEMYRRTQAEGAFNPRVLLGRVLRQPLSAYGEDIAETRWPPPHLVDDLGMPARMPPRNRQRLEQDKGPDASGQYLALFELYGRPETLSSVPTPIFAAFGLQPYGAAEAEAEEVAPLTPAYQLVPAPAPRPLSPWLTPLREWASGKAPAQTLVTEIRKWLYGAIKEATDWNASFLGETFHTSTYAVFTSSSLNLEGQKYNAAGAPIVLEIPRTPTFAVALEGAVLYNQNSGWDFPEAETYLPSYAELIDWCARQVVDRIRRQQSGDNAWQGAAAAATELLAVHRLVSGALPSLWAEGMAGRDEAHLLDLIVAPDPASFTATAGRRCPSSLLALEQSRVELRSLLLARLACAKGPSTENTAILDAAPVLGVLRRIVKGWKPAEPLPSTPLLRGTYARISELRNRLETELPSLYKTEAEHLQSDLALLNQHLGDAASGGSTQRAREAVRTASSGADVLGVWRSKPGSSHETLGRVMDSFKVTRIDRLRARAMEEGPILTASGLWQLFDAELRGEISAAARFVEEADLFITLTGARIDQELGALLGSGSADEAAAKEVEEQLATALDILDALTATEPGL